MPKDVVESVVTRPRAGEFGLSDNVRRHPWIGDGRRGPGSGGSEGDLYSPEGALCRGGKVLRGALHHLQGFLPALADGAQINRPNQSRFD